LEKGKIVKGKKEQTPVNIDQEVVEDINLISSSGPHDIPKFIEVSLKKLK